ncbi:hypothetical protein CVU76_02860 [Candidatus Dojkabacteria bacterium HGW-Dojkabacteria-1]|uniref:Uncharacterized protein n=1 Tax=Candidatus Dojkabacteria bacterium HGW-Dojkabacteria-1 TaxID=2013761 RepID=A0A2N2F407_9BACT|nr:MAG: hypothetical protein CVU76_02860 [Candidatus Dojkabacteria bacterium HGW-Dojkabacteria-1]
MFRSTDPIHDNARERAIEFVRSQIINMIENGDEGDVVDAIVQEISLSDIYTYMTYLKTDQSLPFKLPLIRYANITDENQYAMVCDYVSAYRTELPPRDMRRVYFIETADFAITFIPIQLDGEEINIHIEPLDCSPDFILEMWDKVSNPKSLDDIEWVKFDNIDGEGD